MKIDPYKNEQRYLARKERIEKNGIPGVSLSTARIIKAFLTDMETGLNIAQGSKKGPRSYSRLNTLRDRLTFFANSFKRHFGINSITDITEEQLHQFFASMRNGQIRKRNGTQYRSTADYVKDFNSFWHWYMKVNKKAGRQVVDICVDLDNTKAKPNWVYLTEDQVRRLCDNATYKYKVLMMFLFDSGIRSPTELVNVRVKDLSHKCTRLHIREDTSKTFGRTINLMLCPQLLQGYIRDKELQDEDHVFAISAQLVNRYLKRLAKRVLGVRQSLAGDSYATLTMYDLRHSSACYWLPRYKSESALKYRFGWKKSDMIYYYTELLGMKDTITEDDLLVDVTKTEIEQRLEKSEKHNMVLQEKIHAMDKQMEAILQMVQKIGPKVM